MPEQVTISVVIPAYHEEENLRVLLPRLNATLGALAVPYEILVIDARTKSDNTDETCRTNKVTYINREVDDSYGSAVRTGIQHARYTHVLFMDADGSHTPEFISSMFPFIPEYDIVIASRYVQGGYTENSPMLIAMSWLVNFVYALVLGLKCKDVSNSFKIYRAAHIKEVQLKCDNFDVVEEILYKINKKNPDIRIKEVPFSFKKRMFGNTKRNLVHFIMSYVFTLLKLRFGK